LDYLKLTYDSAMSGLDASLRCEVICVDDNSDAPTREYLASVACDTLILNRKRRGSTGGTSQAHRIALGRYVAILDSDVILPRYWLSNMVAELQRCRGVIISSARFSGLCHPSTREPLRFAWNRIKKEHAGKAPSELFGELSDGRTVETFGDLVLRAAHATTSEVLCPPDCVGSSCMVYEHAFVDRVGGYLDYGYFPYGAEDVDLCWRVGMAGGRVLRSGTTYVHHFEHAGWEANGFDHIAARRDNERRLFERWRPQLCAFINAQVGKGIGIAELRARYWLLDLFLAEQGSPIRVRPG
jgi:GT2 family glycosyltransferase